MEETTHESDEMLVIRAQAGEETAFSALVRRYEQPLYAYARRMLGTNSEVEDIFQETFLRVFTHLDTFQPERKFRPWLYSIATNLCRDRFRFRWRRPSVPLDELPELAARGAGTDAVASAHERAARLEAAVAALPTKHRAVFLMARYEDMAYEDIAAALGVPVGTVKSRMNKAVRLLLERMKYHEY